MITRKWDIRYLDLAALVASWSKDPSTQTGAVIVAPPRRIISVGFNGFPRVMEDRPEWYANRDEKLSRVIHAEVNALLLAGDVPAGCTLYTHPFPCCDRCFVQMLQAGITRFVAPTPTPAQRERWGTAWDKVMSWAAECGVEYDLLDR
jgi:dCMP deaminase